MTLSSEQFDATGRKDFGRGGKAEKGTGNKGGGISKPHRTVVYPFGIYEVTIRLGDSNEFLGIVEVKADKDFIAFKQKISNSLSGC